MNRTPILLAIYDLDKTITRRPTFAPFLKHALRTRAQWRCIFVPLVALTTLFYAVRLIDRGRLKELNHALLIGPRLPAAEAERLVASFAEATSRNNVSDRARAQIEADRAEGRRLVLASASYTFYIRAIAALLCFDDTIGTDCARGLDDTILARIDGENCYGAAKRRKVEAWLAREGLARDAVHIRFYSDHVSDAPMFEFADEAIAVNAQPPLVTLAKRRNWRLEHWHQPSAIAES